jgi:ubiquinone/menaquinone biosynthesis C-methylase UbiE
VITAADRGFSGHLAAQLALPVGTVGRLLGGAMDLANRRPTRLAVDLLEPRPGERLLDAGCGTGAAMAAVLRRAPCRVSGADPSHAMLIAAERRLRRKWLGRAADLHCAGLDNLPFADHEFDAALLLNVLYFCDYDGQMLANLHRVLRPGGRIVAYVTHRDTMQHWAFAQTGYHRLFDEAELTRAFVLGGFAPNRICVHAVPIARGVKGLLARVER